MKKKDITFTLTVALATNALLCAAFCEEDWTRIYAVEDPVVSEDGKSVVFTWCDTNWVASVTGGMARVTSAAPRVSNPGAYSKEMYEAMAGNCALSPDTNRVAFSFRGDKPFRRRRGTYSSRAGEVWLFDGKAKSYRQLSPQKGENSNPVWTSGRTIAYLAENGEGGRDIRQVDVTTDADTVLVPCGQDDHPNWLTGSAAGRVLVARRGWDLWRYDLDERCVVTNSTRLIFHPERMWKGRAPVRRRHYTSNWNDGFRDSAFKTPDGRDIIFTAGGELWAIEPGNGTNKACRIHSDQKSHDKNCVLSPDGKVIYYLRDFGDHAEIWSACRKDPSKAWHTRGAIIHRRILGGNGLVSRLDISPQGDMLSWVDRAGGFYSMSTNKGAKAVNRSPKGTIRYWEYEWSPDGKYVSISAADKKRNVEIWVIPMRDKGGPVNVSYHFEGDNDPEWTTNSTTLVFSSRVRAGYPTSYYSVDMKKPLKTGCCRVVSGKELGKIRSALVKYVKPKMPKFRVTVDTNIADYQQFAFLTVWARLKANYYSASADNVDWKRLREKYLPAARNAPSWRQFQRVMLQMCGELDASHLYFSATDEARKEWSIPKYRSAKRKRKLAKEDVLRSRVEKESKGTWGYVRVASMDKDDYDKFLVDLYRNGHGRKGIILDLRGNTGGHCADRMIDCLVTTPQGWSDWQRGGRGYSPDHLGFYRFQGKIIALIDERTFSNGEMMAHTLKSLDRATLVGRPTAGGVLATVNIDVLDWGEYRVPMGRWFSEEGVEMENHGAEPHVRVDDTPAELARNVDSQFEKALELMRNTP